MSKHTPGPWWSDEPRSTYIFAKTEAGDQMVAETRGFGADLPQEANGRLLAAAPELLEACEAFYQAYTNNWTTETTDAVQRLVIKARNKVMGVTAPWTKKEIDEVHEMANQITKTLNWKDKNDDD